MPHVCLRYTHMHRVNKNNGLSVCVANVMWWTAAGRLVRVLVLLRWWHRHAPISTFKLLSAVDIMKNVPHFRCTAAWIRRPCPLLCICVPYCNHCCGYDNCGAYDVMSLQGRQKRVAPVVNVSQILRLRMKYQWQCGREFGNKLYYSTVDCYSRISKRSRMLVFSLFVYSTQTK